MPETATTPDISTAALSTWEDLKTIDHLWREEAERQGNPFATPEWHRSTAEDADPLVIVTREAEGQICGVLPFVESQWRGIKALRPAGAELGDRFHPIVAAGTDRRMVSTHLFTAAMNTGKAVVADRYSDDAWEALGHMNRHEAVCLDRAELPYIHLGGGSWEDYLAAKSRNFRQQVRRAERKLFREQQVSIRETDRSETLQEDLNTFFRLHDKRRAKMGGTALDSPQKRKALLRFAEHSLARGWLRLRLMYVNGQPAAGFMGWSVGRNYLFYQSGFDPGWSESRVGLVSLGLAIQQACEEGADRFDLLLGSEQYKQRLATDSDWVETRAICARLSAANIMARSERAARSLRRRIRTDA